MTARARRVCSSRCCHRSRPTAEAPAKKPKKAAFWPESQSHFEQIRKIAEDGLNLFERLFGYRSASLVPCNYVMPADLEAFVGSHGVKLIQGQRGQLRPSTDGATMSTRRGYTGQRNRQGQLYGVRNVKFEPHLVLIKGSCPSTFNKT